LVIRQTTTAKPPPAHLPANRALTAPDPRQLSYPLKLASASAEHPENWFEAGPPEISYRIKLMPPRANEGNEKAA